MQQRHDNHWGVGEVLGPFLVMLAGPSCPPDAGGWESRREARQPPGLLCAFAAFV